ncbi:MAG: TonB family protein [Bacteroidetes bacterium]|nr:TonB family protein [Bacteroidota bacterium]
MPPKTFATLIILFSWVSLYAQTNSTDLLKNATVYYLKNNGEFVDIKDSADYIRVIQPDTTEQFLYTVSDFYLTGKPKTIGKSLTPGPGLKRQGMFIEYFKNGHRKSIENYENGKQAGDMVFYYPNGKPYYTAIYDTSKKQVLVNQVTDTAGNVMAENGKGRWLTYDDDFKRVTGEGPIVDGLKEGEWHGNANDSVKYICLYSKGTSVSGKSYERSGTEHTFTKDIINAEFNGGEKAFSSFLGRNIHYPAAAREYDVQGRVFVSFIVEKDGRLTHFKILRGISYGCDEEVIRVLRLSPPWIPGYRYGVPASCQYTQPVTFALTYKTSRR